MILQLHLNTTSTMIWTHDLPTCTFFIYPIDHFAFGKVASTLGGLAEVTLVTSNINQE